MKKLLLIVSFIALGIVSAFAQKGEKAIGINLGYGTEVSNVGLGAKFQYGITDAIWKSQTNLTPLAKKN